MLITNTAYFAIAVLAASIFAFTESRLKLAPFCIGGNSTAVMGQLLDLLLNEHEAPELIFELVEVLLRAVFGPAIMPARSLERIQAKIGQVGHVNLLFSPSQPPGWSMKRYL